MEFRAALLDYMERVSILAAELDYSTGKLGYIAKPIMWQMEKHESGAYIKDATIDLSLQEATSLMSALWNAGVRPADYKSPAGEVRRLEAHLADMQKLVFQTK